LRGWRFEHERAGGAGGAPLGISYAIAIRAEEVAHDPEGEMAHWVNENIKSMGRYRPSPESRWSDMIEWFTCEEPHREITEELMTVTARDVRNFCTSLGRPNSVGDEALVHDDGPMGFHHSIDNGAAIVISILAAGDCADCKLMPSRQSAAAARACPLGWVKESIIDRVDKRSEGLYDLPHIIRDIRQELVKRNSKDLRLGVYMEKLRKLRLESDRLSSQLGGREW
jgi:hypothetical protein